MLIRCACCTKIPNFSRIRHPLTQRCSDARPCRGRERGNRRCTGGDLRMRHEKGDNSRRAKRKCQNTYPITPRPCCSQKMLSRSTKCRRRHRLRILFGATESELSCCSKGRTHVAAESSPPTWTAVTIRYWTPSTFVLQGLSATGTSFRKVGVTYQLRIRPTVSE
jgi:hypothetical protein